MSTDETKQDTTNEDLKQPQDESFEDLFNASKMGGSGEGLAPGQRIKGTIVRISDESAVINLGGKADGVISSSELKNDKGELAFKVGDVIDAYVVSSEEGQTKLAKAAQLNRGGDRKAAIEDAFKAQVPVDGTVTGHNKGGFDVKIMGLRAFCPMSQIDMGRVEKPELHVNQNYRFKITEFKEGGRSIVVSRTALLKEEAAAKNEQLMQSIKVGDIVEGVVRSLRDFGAFVDLGGAEGLIHVSEMAWGRVNHPKEVLENNQKVKVKVLKIEEQAGKKLPRIGLTLRGLENNPWEKVGVDFKQGETYEGSIVRMAQFGAFVELAPGLEGLVHISELSWGKRVNRPEDVVAIGQKVRVLIQTADAAQKRLSLSMKSTEEDPWSSIAARYMPGQQVTGKVEKVAAFGVFVTLDSGITALLPNSESDARNPAQEFPVGSEVTGQILEVDPTRRRLTLSRKALAQRQDNENFTAYKAERSATRAPDRNERASLDVDRSEKNDGSRRRDKEKDRDRQRGEEFEDEDGGFGSLGDLIKAKNNSRKRK
jgi:small subunit ribosomal protein S1